MTKEIGLRLALRIEGTQWNAYMAQTGTMNGAVLLGSIAANLAAESPALKDAFIDLMVCAYSDMVLSVTGSRPVGVEIRKAPEHKRSGRA